MITVTHEVVVPEVAAHVETKTFKLVELDLFYKGFRIMLRVPETIREECGSSLQGEANHNLDKYFSGLRWGEM